MKRKAYITITFNGKTFNESFPIEEHIQEYQVADKAYCLALLYARTQLISMFGHIPSFHKVASLFETLDYTYRIEEVSA